MLINQEILQNPSPLNEYGGGCYKMKKLLIVLLFFGFSFGQSEEIVFSNQLKTNTLLEVFKETNFKDTLHRIYYENGQIREEGIYKDNEMDGLWIGYFPNGQVQFVGNFKNSKRNGYYILNHENGKMKVRGVYKDDIPEGFIESYHDNGRLKSIGFVKDGKRDGISSFYSIDGDIDRNELWFQGQLLNSSDYLRKYHENGQLKEEQTWRNGKLDGPYKYYNENGQLKKEETYEDGKLIDSKEY